MRTPIHPGQILSDELQALNLSSSRLAKALHVPVNRITQILKSQRAITADTALRLGRFLGPSAGFWLNLQTMYELDRAALTHAPDIEAIRPLAQA